MDLIGAKKIILDNILRLKKCDDEGLVRIAAKIDPIDILSWLKAQRIPKRLYWRNRASRFVCAGLGEAISVTGGEFLGYKPVFEDIKRYLKNSSSGVRFYGGFNFPSTIKEKEWDIFGYYHFLVPLFELIKRPDGMYFVCNLKTPLKDIHSIAEQLEGIEMASDTGSTITESVQYSYRRDTPDLNEWEKDVNNTIEEIKNNKLVKVVLARKSTFKLSQGFDVYSFFGDPKWKGEKAYHFFIQLAPHHIFMSMSPERIYFRDRNYIETEAIAGTRRRGRTLEEDKRFSEELKNNFKELQEHRLVSKVLEEKMSRICASVKLELKEEILSLSYMQHLYTRFSGKLREGVSDDRIISALYPNPAIAGYPIRESLKKIEEVERFARGWYSGPFGWISSESVEFVVSIRSGLLSDDFLHLYSGAGLVQGSDPLNEWKELDNKILNFTSLLKNVRL